MKVPFSSPSPSGSERSRSARELRKLAAEIARLRPQALTKTNLEESDQGPQYPNNFTKGLKHDKCGLLEHAVDYHCFVEAINSKDAGLFDKHVSSAKTYGVEYSCEIKTDSKCPGSGTVKWRGWESPRAGHAYELEGADPGAVGMAPAPRVASSELAAEMAEVYAMALLRDVPFNEIAEGGAKKLCPEDETEPSALLSAQTIASAIGGMAFYQGDGVKSATPHHVNNKGLNQFESNRRFARTLGKPLTAKQLFRGSTKGALAGPYISQFMLIGTPSLSANTPDGVSSFPDTNSAFGIEDGFVQYGSQIIDQRVSVHKGCLDYMTDWSSWLDVQNGANFKNTDLFEEHRRFITTPRDLATYVHFDALYQAYLNACLILQKLDVPASKGFPEPSLMGHRDSFATFGGPHVLSLVTEVATRCLKAVRRQKFNYHRRARPEAVGGRLTLVGLGLGEKLGASQKAYEHLYACIPNEIREAIIAHNEQQNGDHKTACRQLICDPECRPPKADPASFAAHNLLLPMAFPEGSPMHPAYGAGHATVAGGCVTMLKAFFDMYEQGDSHMERKLTDADGNAIAYVPNGDGSALTPTGDKLTVQGELDKLAANISIGRNMAGVHYYSDYYDSLRMGERVAVSILMEQAITYGEPVESTFKSFDGDMITLQGDTGSCPILTVIDKNGAQVTPEQWWLRHVVGRDLAEDISLAS